MKSFASHMLEESINLNQNIKFHGEPGSIVSKRIYVAVIDNFGNLGWNRYIKQYDLISITVSFIYSYEDGVLTTYRIDDTLKKAADAIADALYNGERSSSLIDTRYYSGGIGKGNDEFAEHHPLRVTDYVAESTTEVQQLREFSILMFDSIQHFNTHNMWLRTRWKWGPMSIEFGHYWRDVTNLLHIKPVTESAQPLKLDKGVGGVITFYTAVWVEASSDWDEDEDEDADELYEFMDIFKFSRVTQSIDKALSGDSFLFNRAAYEVLHSIYRIYGATSFSKLSEPHGYTVWETQSDYPGGMLRMYMSTNKDHLLEALHYDLVDGWEGLPTNTGRYFRDITKQLYPTDT